MSISDALTLTPLKSGSPAVGSLEEALGNADCPLGRNEWLAEDGRSLTPKGKTTVVEYCWEAQVLNSAPLSCHCILILLNIILVL